MGAHKSKTNQGRLWSALVLLMSNSAVATEAGTDGRTEPIVIEVKRLSPDAGRGEVETLIGPSLVGLDFFFHSGDFDYFNTGEPASGEFRNELIRRGFTSRTLVSPDVPWRALVGYPRFNAQIGDTEYPITKVYLHPIDHRYVSFGGKIFPSDDAFVGNDNPRQYPVFNEHREFLGPLIIEIYGRDVLDGGVRVNDEQGIPGWDRGVGDGYTGSTVEEPIRPHPGFNGSQANPDGTPVIFLNELDAQKADFTREPYPIARIRISSGLDASFSGNWYNPAHDGEGFIFDITTNAQGEKLLAVDWFTYQPDGGGEQLWLNGVGRLRDGVGVPDEFKLEMELLEPVGGRFASEDNPETVERVPWGTMTLQFGDCDRAQVTLNPLDSAYEREPYLIERLTPPPAGTKHWCNDNREFSWMRFMRWLGIDPPP